jgi:hypothetical protein
VAGAWYFAWAGGTITEQQTVVTNGNTHGGTVQSVTIVADITAGSGVLANIASNSGLTVGELYEIAGPGIPAGTFFVHDTGKLNAAGSINLSAPSTTTVKAANFTATKAVSVGAVAATLTAGSNVVTLGAIDLPAGPYAIFGPGIGNTTAPDAAVIAVPSAYFEHDGSSTTATLLAMSNIAGSVAAQPVTATATGLRSLAINGMPDRDWYTITAIPPGALASLTAGLRYNIAGNGIEVGTTFVAAPAATTITLDQPATATGVNALLTITGPRTPNADFDPAIHNREDEQIVGLEITQEEGGFATLTIEIKNPNIGLLAFGRNLWCWLSWDQAWTPGGVATPDLVPLFNGRLIGVPRLSAGEIVSLQFLARPDDYNGQKDAVVKALSVLPYYDPVWLANTPNADTVLETMSSLWHVHRTSLVLNTSDILEGEAGIITIGEDAGFYDAFSLAYGSPPLTAVTVSGTVSWEQQGEGAIDITQRIIKGFADAGSPYNSAFGLSPLPPKDPRAKASFQPTSGGGLISVICGDGLRTSWPAPGTSIGGGWSLSTDNEATGRPLCYCISATAPEGWMQAEKLYISQATQQAPVITEPSDAADLATFNAPWGLTYTSFPINIYKVRMVLDWRASRQRTETVTAVLTANVQRELSDTADSDHEDIALTSEFVAQGVDPGGQVPLGSAAQRSYFQTGRGTQSFEYLLLAARAKLRARARSVDITFAVDWPTALGITLRHSVAYSDRRLPGGTATGKVKSYKLTAGDTMFGEFTIGCAIGNDDVPVAAVGVPSYVDAGYVDTGYQVISGGQTMLVDDEIAYQTLDDFVIADDGLDLTNITVDQSVEGFSVVNGLTKQMNTLAAFDGTVAPADGDPVSAMAQMSTAVTLDMRPVTGTSFHTNFYPAVTQVWLPKTIDLAAAVG